MSPETLMSVEGHFAQLITKTGEEAVAAEVSLPRAFTMSDFRAGRALITEEECWKIAALVQKTEGSSLSPLNSKLSTLVIKTFNYRKVSRPLRWHSLFCPHIPRGKGVFLLG